MRDVGAIDAATNNAAWCDAVCRAHGHPGELTAAHWLNRSAAPPYYPNLVTLDPSEACARSAIGELRDAGLDGAWAVKDSFGVLPLDRAGFRLLLEADWLVQLPPRGSGGAALPGIRWVVVESAAMLARWEAAWGQSRGRPRIFLPPLLSRTDVTILAGCEDDAIVAGVVANRTGELVGLSNLFVPASPGGSIRAACVQAVHEVFPGLPLVGYETASGLAEFRALGFEAVGRLRVWVNRA